MIYFWNIYRACSSIYEISVDVVFKCYMQSNNMSSFEIQALLRLFKCNLVHGQNHLSNLTQAILSIQKL